MRRNRERVIKGCTEVTSEECGGDPDKMIRRFTKKVKANKILEEYRERSHFKKPSEARREEKSARQRVIDKVNRQREELFNFTGKGVRRPTTKKKHRG